MKLLWKTINEIICQSKMTSLPNCVEVEDAKVTNSQDIAYVFNSRFLTNAKNLLAQNQPLQISCTASFTNFNYYNTFFIYPIFSQEIELII